MSLTDLQIRKITPKKQRFEVLDDKGLYIRIMPSGRKSWIFRYSFKGKARRITFGSYPAMSLSQVREKHAKAMQDIETGIDPGKKVQEAKAKFKESPNIKDIIDELWEKELQKKKSGVQTLKLLQKDIIPAWGGLKVSDIKRRDIVLLLDRIVDRGSPITRNRVHSALTRLFNFSAERGVIDDSPCTRIRKLPEAYRDRVLSDNEIKMLWQAVDIDNKEIDLYITTKLALKLQILTGQRSGEICGMTWSELDFDNNTWKIPASRMKNNQVHVLPLSNMALEVIEQARGFLGNNTPYVFLSSHYENKPITAHSLSRAILRHRQELGIETPFTPHDIRRTIRTKLAQLGVNEFIAERILGHKLQGMLAVYNQHDYLPEKLQALEKWESKLKSIVGITEPRNNDNVIPFEVRHA